MEIKVWLEYYRVYAQVGGLVGSVSHSGQLCRDLREVVLAALAQGQLAHLDGKVGQLARAAGVFPYDSIRVMQGPPDFVIGIREDVFWKAEEIARGLLEQSSVPAATALFRAACEAMDCYWTGELG